MPRWLPDEAALAELGEDAPQVHDLLADEEYLPFKDDSLDLILSSMHLHWVNDLPGALKQIQKSLKPDGAFVANMLGGSTLEELKHCFYLANMERRGGLAPHTSPMVEASDMAGLMQDAGFTLPTVDVDTITVSGFARNILFENSIFRCTFLMYHLLF
jgi:NADH dehydrogenase [ubiquinone] 1 alpha subcomplex assembly factor 5